MKGIQIFSRLLSSTRCRNFYLQLYPMKGIFFNRHGRFRQQKGQGMVETLITMPILLLIGAALLQVYFIWETKLTLNQATLLAARAGAVSSINIDQMRNELAKGLLPLQAPDLDDPSSTPATVYATAYINAQTTVVNDVVLRIANPTLEAFTDFAPQALIGIPNDHLQARSNLPVPNGVSGVSVQDANLLRIQIAYGMNLDIPFIGPIIFSIIDASTDPNAWYRPITLDRGLFPVLSVATVRMQSNPQLNDGNRAFFMSRLQVQNAI